MLPKRPSFVVRLAEYGRSSIAVRRNASLIFGSLLSVLLGLLGAAPLGAQETVSRRTYSELDGLPHCLVSGITQDDFGRVWAVTGAGVTCFDGRSMRSIDHERMVTRANHRTWLLPAAEGRVWLVHDDDTRGIHLLRAGSIVTSTPVFPADEFGEIISAQSTYDRPDAFAVATDRGRVFVGTEDRWSEVRLPEGHRVRALACADDAVYGFGSQGLVRLDDQGASVVAGFPFPEGREAEGYSLVVQESDGRRVIWASDKLRLARFDVGTWTIVIPDLTDGGVPSEDPVTMTPLADGSLAIATIRTLRRLDTTTGTWVVPEAASPWPTGAHAIYDDGARIWIGNFRGLTALNRQDWTDHPRLDEFFAREVTALAFQKNYTLFGHDRGLSILFKDGKLEPRAFAPEPGKNPDSIRVLEMARDGEGGVWVAANARGLMHIDPRGTQKWLAGIEDPRADLDEGPATPQFAIGVLPDGPGAALVGTNSGVWRFQRDGRAPERVFPKKPQQTRFFCRRLARDARGRLLIGTSARGVWRQDAAGFRRLGVDDREAIGIYSFVTLPDGRTLVGARDGLFVIRGERLMRFRDLPGLDLRIPVYALLHDESRGLFVGTRTGAVWIRANGFRHFTVEHGLGGQEANRGALARGPDGRIFAGTNGGLSVLSTTSFRPDDEPQIRITNLRDNAGPLDVSNEVIRLRAGSASLSFGLSTVCYGPRAQCKYRYRLIGLHEDWMEPGETFPDRLEFPRLDPGNYALAAQIRSANGTWSPTVLSPEVVVSAPLWKNPWLIGSIFAGLVLLGWFGRVLISSRQDNRQLSRTLRQAERELAQTDLLYAAAFQRHRVAQLMLEPRSRRITDINRAGRQLLGIEGSDAGSLTLDDFSPLAPHELAERVRGCFERPSLQKLPLLVQDGEETRTVEALFSPLTLRRQQRVQAVLLDVTDQHRLEKELRGAYKQLAVGRVTRGMAHDFNNLLQIIGGNSELALDEAEQNRGGEALREGLTEIRDASQRGADLVRRLADLGREAASPAVGFRIDDAIAAAADEMDLVLIEYPELVIERHVKVGDAALFGDELAFRSVLIELVINARDAHPGPGTIVLEAGRFRGPDDSERVRIEIRDDGPGFPPDALDRVTEPFFTTKLSGDRRGLGLAEVGRFATRSGGRLRVENRDEGGARVRMEFPARDLREPRPDAPSVSIRREGASGVAFVGRPGPQRRWIVDVLQGQGCSIFECADGPEALRLFSYLGHEIRLLVLSADLGGLAPEDLARVLRSEAEGLEVTSELDLELVLRESDGTLSFAGARKG